MPSNHIVCPSSFRSDDGSASDTVGNGPASTLGKTSLVHQLDQQPGAILSTHAPSDSAADSCHRLLSAPFKVISATAYILFYALVAAASPLVLTATLVVLRSERPRTNGIAFLTGFLLGTTIAAALALILGQAAVERLDSHETIQGVMALLVGVALITAGLRKRHGPSRPDTETGQRSAIIARLSHVRPGEALSVALVLGFGGPKRLVLTFLAMASLSQADLRRRRERHAGRSLCRGCDAARVGTGRHRAGGRAPRRCSPLSR